MTESDRTRNLTKMYDLDEGVRLEPYQDTKGFWTIGIGHLIGATLNGFPFKTINRSFADELLREDMAQAHKSMLILFGDQVEAWTEARYAAVHALTFTLGLGKFKRFFSTLPAIREGRWEAAAEHLLKTKWASDVDPKRRDGSGRDDRIAYMLRTGEWHPYYQIA